MDEIDRANDYAQKTEESSISSIRKAAADIPVGYAGECYYCEEESKRLVRGACAPCRDKYKL